MYMPMAGKRKRKSRTAAQIREGKRARAAQRDKASSDADLTRDALKGVGEGDFEGISVAKITGACASADKDKHGGLAATVACEVAEVGGC
ncbi:hypothetical protein PR002_g12905 [Phytophthora rubi]|uniref:Uncharacterized protein n=1 Tax=Phytophthora rubi TaxID=129364 RepID=A0A6A3LI32_9STRA|nr:hypothetical protein PR002_g12905 [Phytophthora rubi]